MGGYPTNLGDASVAEIEKEVDRERGQVADTIDALQSKISVNGLVDEVLKVVSANGREVSRALGRSVRENPLPLILTGVGLAWLMASSSGSGAQSRARGDADSDEWERLRRSGSTRKTSESSASPPFVGDGIQRVSGAEAVAEADKGYAPSESPSSERGVPGGLQETLGGLGETARDALAGAGNTISTVTDSLAHAGGRARAEVEQRTRGVQESLMSVLDEQPLVLGGLALALGAALGGVLPRTASEDKLMGSQADRLKKSAADVFATESAKVSSVAGAVANEAMEIVDEAAGALSRQIPDGAALVEKAKDAARDATDRLKTVAEEEAKQQALGSTITTEPVHPEKST